MDLIRHAAGFGEQVLEEGGGGKFDDMQAKSKVPQPNFRYRPMQSPLSSYAISAISYALPAIPLCIFRY